MKAQIRDVSITAGGVTIGATGYLEYDSNRIWCKFTSDDNLLLFVDALKGINRQGEEVIWVDFSIKKVFTGQVAYEQLSYDSILRLCEFTVRHK